MKFLCPQCKAKYQIADDKIDGRTLRMKCRRCEHEIVVKGDLAIAESEPPPPAAKPAGGRTTTGSRPAAGPSAGARRPAGAALASPAASPTARAPVARGAGSALGADFRRQMSAGAAEPSRSSVPSPLDAWHVAIHEVPVGPMKRDELVRKIAAGAVTGESLCWREGFDDWRPLRDVAELSPLLRRTAAPPPPATRPSVPGARVAPPGGRPPPAAARPGAPGRATGAGAGQRPAAPGARGAAPAARSNVVPIGGRGGAAAAPVYDEQPDDFDAEPTMIAQSPLEAAERMRASAPDAAALAGLVGPSPAMTPHGAMPAFESPVFVPQQATYAEPQRRRKPMSPFVWIAMAGAGVFGMTLAAMIGTSILRQPAVAPVVAVVAPAPAPTQETVPAAPIQIPDAPAPAVVEEIAAVIPPSGSRTPTKRGNGAPPTLGVRQLSAAEQAAIDRMTGGGSAGSNLAPPVRPTAGGAPAGQAAELSPAQLRAVVTRNRPGLQHCYEMAARQTGSSETMRANIEIAVGGSGVVTRVSVTGNAPTQLTSCLEGQVRRWHFPAGGEAAFPVVFSPGG